MSEQNKPFISVQPENRTVIEEGLEYGWHHVMSQQPNPYPHLKQPNDTPDQFVSLLADERGVLDWHPDDTLAHRRKMADQAFAIHRQAGTRSGITLALNVLGVEAKVTRAAPPYSLSILCGRRHSTIDKLIVDRMISRIEQTKSERDSYELSLLFHSELKVAMSAGCYSLNISNIYAYASIGTPHE